MKNKNKKYILVDASKINVTTRECQRVSGFNDFWNEYPVTGIISATQVFDTHEIPTEFQKVAFATPTLFDKYGQEVLTGRRFEITRYKGNYYGDECQRYYNGDVIPGSLEFTVPLEKTSYKAIQDFYLGLTEAGYLETYLEAIQDMLYFRKSEAQDDKRKVDETIKKFIK